MIGRTSPRDPTLIAIQTSKGPSSALINAAWTSTLIASDLNLSIFLAWQAARCHNVEEQQKIFKDALLYPGLLVFAIMRKKSLFIHLIQSAGTYPKVPGANGNLPGKRIGFLGDQTKYAIPNMVELGKNTAWGWDDMMLPTDLSPMDEFYQNPNNRMKFWVPKQGIP